VVTFPAALAAAEEAGASGKELLTAAVLGYEVTIRVALGVLPSHYLRGFHATATCGVLGGAAAAARLLGAGAEGIESALGLAASSASGLLEFFKKGSHVKRLHGGFAGEASVRAALLVREGLEGPRGVLEGELGFGRAFSDAPSWDLALSGLGEDFKIGETCFKTHAGGGHFHAAVDAALRLAGRLRPRWEEVEEVDVGTLEAFARAAGQGEPADLQMAQMNLPFNVALALVEGGRRGEFWFPLTLSDFERGLADQEVLSVARRVRCEPDEEVAARADDAHLPARVKIRMRDGRREEEFLEYARGTAGCPLTRDELEGRFLETLGRHLGLSRAEDALSALGQIEGSSSITSILRLFVRSD